MIPYDDLVAALQSWRVRQGLPVSAGAVIAAQTAAPSGPVATPGSGPRTAPPAPPRTNPPAAPAARAPMPLAAPEDSLDVDAAHLLDEQVDEQVYENEGDDFALAFGKNENSEATQIGDGPPAEPTDPTGRGKHEREDW